MIYRDNCYRQIEDFYVQKEKMGLPHQDHIIDVEGKKEFPLSLPGRRSRYHNPTEPESILKKQILEKRRTAKKTLGRKL